MVTAAACGFAATFAGPWFNLNRNEGILAVVVAALAGFMLPWLLVRMGQRRRREEITLALPDALDLMVICVEAGQGLNAALMSVSRESVTYSPALSDEFRLMNLEMSTGLPRAQALKNLALRTGIDDVRALVAVLVQSDRFGTSIGQALRTHAQSLRTPPPARGGTSTEDPREDGLPAGLLRLSRPARRHPRAGRHRADPRPARRQRMTGRIARAPSGEESPRCR